MISVEVSAYEKSWRKPWQDGVQSDLGEPERRALSRRSGAARRTDQMNLLKAYLNAVPSTRTNNGLCGTLWFWPFSTCRIRSIDGLLLCANHADI